MTRDPLVSKLVEYSISNNYNETNNLFIVILLCLRYIIQKISYLLFCTELTLLFNEILLIKQDIFRKDCHIRFYFVQFRYNITPIPHTQSTGQAAKPSTRH